jgi:hypothetical protein
MNRIIHTFDLPRMSAHRGDYTPVSSRVKVASVVREDDQVRDEDAVLLLGSHNENDISLENLIVSGNKSLIQEKAKTLPAYDRAIGTRNACIAGLLFSFAVSITCISIAPWAFRSRKAFQIQSGGYSECPKPFYNANMRLTIGSVSC